MLLVTFTVVGLLNAPRFTNERSDIAPLERATVGQVLPEATADVVKCVTVAIAT